MTISYDRSWNSVLVSCDECPYWFALRLDQREAYIAGEGHAVRVHGIAPERAADARRLWAKRHAVNP